MLKYYNSKSDHQKDYRIPPPYILAFGYFTAAIRGEVPKIYNLYTVTEWAKTRPWSTVYIDHKDFKSQCKEVKKYLDKWFTITTINTLSESNNDSSEKVTDNS